MPKAKQQPRRTWKLNHQNKDNLSSEENVSYKVTEIATRINQRSGLKRYSNPFNLIS